MLSLKKMFKKKKKNKETNEDTSYFEKLTIKENIYRLIQEKYSDCYCLYSRPGLGDVLYISSLIKEFKKSLPDKNSKIVYFTGKKNLVDFIKSFPSVDEVVYSPELQRLQYDRYYITGKIDKNKLNILYSPYIGKTKAIKFSDTYNCYFGLPFDAEHELPIVKPENIKNAKNEFKRLNIRPEKTIIIIPDSTMYDYKQIRIEFWINFENELKQKGYDVVFNGGYVNFYKESKNTLLPIMDFIPFAQKAKYVYSFRNGMCDILVAMDVRHLTVIYPQHLDVLWGDNLYFTEFSNNFEKIYENNFENILNQYSLSYNFGESKVDEYIYDFNPCKLKDHLMSRLSV